MKVIFAHDHRFLLSNDGLAYSKGKIKKELFDLYLQYFDSVTVISRYEESQDSYSFEGLEPINDVNNIKFVPFKNLSNPKELFNFNNINLMCEKIKGCDFVIARLPSEIGLLAIKAAKKLKINYTVEFVACPWDALWNYGGYSSKIYAPIYYLRNRLATKQADSVSYVTSKFLQGRYPSNGISVGVSDVVINTGSKYRVKREINSKSAVNIGLIGSLDSPHKGIGDAIKAVKILLGKGFNINLNILGPGNSSNWNSMCKGIEENVKFCGVRKPGDDVLEWLSSQDIYIQPSLQEGLPRSVIEAMNCGLPVIGSDAGGLPELVNVKYIHAKKNHKQLADLISKLLDEKEYSSMSDYSLNISSKYNKESLDEIREKFWATISSKN